MSWRDRESVQIHLLARPRPPTFYLNLRNSIKRNLEICFGREFFISELLSARWSWNENIQNEYNYTKGLVWTVVSSCAGGGVNFQGFQHHRYSNSHNSITGIPITNPTFCSDAHQANLDKAPRLSISIVIWILSSDTICQLNQFNTNSEAAMLSRSVFLN